MSWEDCKLGDIVNLKRGYDLPKRLRKEGNVPIISSAGISGYHSEKKYDGEGVITGRYGTLGEVYYINGKYWPLNTTLYAQDFKNNYPKFIYYLLKELNLEQYNGAAAVPGLDRKVLHLIKCSIPLIQTQKRIADILSAYDNLIENNLKRIKLLEQAAQNIYKEWFVHLRFPGYENTPINEDTGLPVGWVKSPFNDVSFNNNRKRIPVNGTERSKRQGTYRYYGATGVMDYIDDYIFDGRFLLVAEDGTVYDKIGNAYTQLVEGKFWVNNHAHIISGGKLSVEYLYLAMKHYPIGHLITGAVQLKLSMKNLKRVEVINPSDDILEKFMSIVNPMINQVFILNSQNQKLKLARDILLPRLMNRTIEVE
jgi:type I restriction enzyme S subunit